MSQWEQMLCASALPGLLAPTSAYQLALLFNETIQDYIPLSFGVKFSICQKQLYGTLKVYHLISFDTCMSVKPSP